jgi:hypothetical protein
MVLHGIVSKIDDEDVAITLDKDGSVKWFPRASLPDSISVGNRIEIYIEMGGLPPVVRVLPTKQ